jgi:hypothetical protein
MYIPGFSIKNYGSYGFVRPSLFDESRIKRKLPKTTTPEESKPGFLCWGVVGDLPSPEAVPTVSFVVHKEVSRETTPVKIVNPDDPDQHVDALQTNKMKLEKTVPAEKNNSATEDSSLDGFNDAEKDAFKPATASEKTEDYSVEYNPPERAL